MVTPSLFSFSLALVLSSIPVAVRPRAQEEPCEPGWAATFGGEPGMDASVDAVASFDDGSGPRLFAGGSFTQVEGLPLAYLARWDGASWSPVGQGLNGPVSAMVVCDHGSGAVLYVGGSFTTAGGAPANGIARWDGASWSALGTGLSAGALALASFDDGSGPALFAGGTFTSAGGVAASCIAKWDGMGWSALGSGLSSNGTGPEVRALAAWDGGGGPALYACGTYAFAGGAPANNIARWNGTSWSALGSGLNLCDFSCEVLALAAHDDGTGSALYVGGNFHGSGSVGAESLIRWNGSTWSRVGTASSGGTVLTLASHDDGGGPALYVGGFFGVFSLGSNLLKWTGAGWELPGGGVQGGVHALTAHDDGSGTALIAGGSFPSSGGVETQRIARFEGGSWEALAAPPPVGDTVRTLAWLDDGSGHALYAGGDFTRVGDVPANRVARWDGASWAALGEGLNGPVRALAMYDDGGGTGPRVYAAGSFARPGGPTWNCVAFWDGATWSSPGNAFFSGTSQWMHALAVFDDGSGPVLCVGGDFVQVNGVTSRRFARWNGSSWILQTGQGFQNDVRALVVFDDGSGPALYAGGDFTSATGTSNANGIARFVGGSVWASLGGGLPSASISALAAYDTSGAGPELHAGGTYVDAGGTHYGVWRWNGASWIQLGSGTNGDVVALTVFDELAGTGPALYAGGSFTLAGGAAAERVARWNGTSWSALDGGPSGPVLAVAASTASGGNCPALFVGGEFGTSPAGDRHLARWLSCADVTPPTISCPPSIVRRDVLASPPGETVHFTVTATDERDASPEVVCVPPSGSHFRPGTTLVTCTATDDAGNSSSCEFTVTVVTRIRR